MLVAISSFKLEFSLTFVCMYNSFWQVLLLSPLHLWQFLLFQIKVKATKSNSARYTKASIISPPLLSPVYSTATSHFETDTHALPNHFPPLNFSLLSWTSYLNPCFSFCLEYPFSFSVSDWFLHILNNQLRNHFCKVHPTPVTVQFWLVSFATIYNSTYHPVAAASDSPKSIY